MKKIWKRPQLQVLTRTKPEEAVLAACKTVSSGGGGVKAANDGCWQSGCGASCPFTASS